MNRLSHIILGVATFLISFHLYGQSYENCFLEDFKLKKAEIPDSYPNKALVEVLNKLAKQIADENRLRDAQG